MGRIKYEDGAGYNIPPMLQHVIIYFENKGMKLEIAEEFYNFYNVRSWKTGTGYPIKDWKVVATNWIWDLQLAKRTRHKQE